MWGVRNGQLAIVLVVMLVTTRIALADETWTVKSPGGTLSATVLLTAPGPIDGYPPDKVRLYYRVDDVRDGVSTEIVPLSPLGIVRLDTPLVDGLRAVEASEVTAIDDAYEMPHGKRKRCLMRAHEQRLTFQEPFGAQIQVVLRVADDSVAFRYILPGEDSNPHTIYQELTGLRLPPATRAWLTAYQESTKYTPAYENDYLGPLEIGSPCPTDSGWAFPALFQIRDKYWLLATDAAVDGGYCGTRFESEAPDGIYRFRFPDVGEGAGQGDVAPTSQLPWTLPWRVLIISEGLSGIVESTAVQDLNPPSRVADTRWVKPGRVAWSWWSDHDSPRDYEKQLEFIDLAADMGWEYYLVDANWTLMDKGTVRQLIDYAKDKGVGIFLWYNSGGEHNTVTEKPRGCLKLRDVRRFEFEMLRRWGVKGVKIDFFQSDKQNIMKLYLDILEDAAEFELLVNFHGCTVPRGWSRTWPHLLSMEAVKGEECYSFDEDYPAIAPRYNTIVPFTRGVVGPTDLTPCAFSDVRYPHRTTYAHELALPVLLECGLLHFADRVQAYRDLPECAKRFLQEVPVAWDDTRFVAGQPGKFAVIARRKGNRWYLGAINGQTTPTTIDLPCSFLGSGTWDAHLIGDGKDARSFGEQEYRVAARDTIRVKMRAYGGATVRFAPLTENQ
jgi:hypothetical protein